MRITLGVSGGVAAYKSAELVRRLQQEGHSIQVVMTRAAREFITPLTFAALSGQKVITDLFAGEGSGNGEANLESAIEHIAVAQRTDLLVVAPATADILAKFAQGIANDFLSTLYLASTAPVVVAPAMNVNMWQHPATQKNVATLRARGVLIVEPGEGYLACGMIGPGRLAGQEEIVKAIQQIVQEKHDLAAETVLVTAGPTCEDIDPVRFLTNRSSGKMGYAIAEAAAARGAHVVLITGPTSLESPKGVERIDVRTAAEMLQAAQKHFVASTVAIFAAAVADYRAAEPSASKIRRTHESLTIRLEPNPDILATVARDKGERLVVGFAAETDHVAENARKKLAAKNADLIVANDVTFFARDSLEATLPQLGKTEVAHRILDEALRLRAVLRTKPAAHRAGD
jgi:phosphopantothenoylcysteine decarboxylase/phosphopantothenate--cysteine ligase